MTAGWFVTGTDTGVGKTHIAAALLRALADRGLACVGMKPVASGCVVDPAGHRSPDADMLQAASSVAADYPDINPYGFGPAIAPHLAARAVGVDIDLGTIREHFDRLSAVADWVVVEGIGGWLVPLGESCTTADLARRLGLPVILVVGVRLGCLNHAILTVQAIANAGLDLAGWVANQIEPTVELVRENIETLEARVDAPLVGVVPHVGGALTPASVAEYLDVAQLLIRARRNSG